LTKSDPKGCLDPESLAVTGALLAVRLVSAGKDL